MEKIIHNIDLFIVSVHTDNDSSIVFKSISETEAKEAFNNIDAYDLPEGFNRNITATLEKKVLKYNFLLHPDELEYTSLSDFYEDEKCWQLIEEGEPEGIEHKSVISNEERQQQEEEKKYNELESFVIKYITSLSTQTKRAAYLYNTFYALIPFIDGYIQVRIADHFFNRLNVNIGRNIIWDGNPEIGIEYDRKNIYGFFSIHILNLNSWEDYKKDKLGYRSEFRFYSECSQYPDLINYQTFNISDDIYSDLLTEDIKLDIQDGLNRVKNEITKAMKDGVFDKKDADGDLIEFKY